MQQQHESAGTDADKRTEQNSQEEINTEISRDRRSQGIQPTEYTAEPQVEVLEENTEVQESELLKFLFTLW